MYSLSRVVRSQAEWRQSKADEYPEDERNARSAKALFDLAEHAVPLEQARDPRLRYISEFNLAVHDGAAMFGENASRELSRWGFTGKRPSGNDADRFIGRLCALTALDSYGFIGDVSSVEERGAGEWAMEQGLLLEDVERALLGEPRWESDFTAYMDADWLDRNIFTPEANR